MYMYDKYLLFFWTCCSDNQGGIEAAKFISTLVRHADKIVAIDARYNSMPVESLSEISSGLKASKGGCSFIRRQVPEAHSS